MTTPRRYGRPPGPPEDRRNVRLPEVLVTEAERVQVYAAAHAAGYDFVAAYIRARLGLPARPAPEVSEDASNAP